MTRHLLSKETLMQFEYLSTPVPCWESAPSPLLQIAWHLQTRFSQLCRPKIAFFAPICSKHCNSTSFARTKHLTNPNRPYQMPHIASGYKKTVSSVSTHVILWQEGGKPYQNGGNIYIRRESMFQGALAYICKEKNVPILEPLCLGLSYVKKKTCPFWSLYVYFLGRSKTRFNWMIPKLSPFSIRQYQAGHSCVSGGLSYVKKKACPFFNNRNLSGRTTAPNSTQTHLSCPALLEILVAHGSRKH